MVKKTVLFNSGVTQNMLKINLSVHMYMYKHFLTERNVDALPHALHFCIALLHVGKNKGADQLLGKWQLWYDTSTIYTQNFKTRLEAVQFDLC